MKEDIAMSQTIDALLEPNLGQPLSTKVANDLDALCETIAGIVAMPELGGKPGVDQKLLLQLIHERIAKHQAKLEAMHRQYPARPVDPALREWALQQFSEEEVIASIKEIRETGGLTFDDLLAALPPHLTRD